MSWSGDARKLEHPKQGARSIEELVIVVRVTCLLLLDASLLRASGSKEFAINLRQRPRHSSCSYPWDTGDLVTFQSRSYTIIYAIVS